MRDEVFFSYMVEPVRRSDDQDGILYEVPVSHRRRSKDRNEAVKQEIQSGFYQVHGVATRAPARSSCPLRPSAFDDAKTVRAVNALPDDQRHWLKFAYCPEEASSWDDEQGAVVALWRAYQPQVGNVRAATLKKLQGLAHLCVQDMKACQNRGRGVHSPAKLRELLGVPESNWRRDWSPRWRAMQALIRELDDAALCALAQTLPEPSDAQVA